MPEKPRPPKDAGPVSPPTYVAVCGPLSSGKTTLTRLLANRLGWMPVYEDLNTNPYFHDYYQDMPRWGFHVAIQFLLNAMSARKRIANLLQTTPVCQDWYPAEHQGVYNRLMLKEGIMTHREFETCEQLDALLSEDAREPDLVVYLSLSCESILERVRLRQRRAETESITRRYVALLLEEYAHFVNEIRVPILKVVADACDFANTEQGKQDVVRSVLDSLNQNRPRKPGEQPVL